MEEVQKTQPLSKTNHYELHNYVFLFYRLCEEMDENQTRNNVQVEQQNRPGSQNIKKIPKI